MARDLINGKVTFEDDLCMTAEGRKKIDLLVVEPDGDDRASLREVLSTLGFGGVNCQADHATGLTVFAERNFTHVLFSARLTKVPPMEFLIKVLDMDPACICLPTSSDPTIDDVFEMLRIGARGYVLKPFTPSGLEAAIIMATEGEPFSDAILNARDRNEAFSAMAAASLDKLATAKRQSTKFSSAEKDMSQFAINFRSAVSLGRTFAKGGEEELLESMVDFFTKLSDGPASRLGRLRKRLRNRRVSDLESERESSKDTSTLSQSPNSDSGSFDV